MSVNINPAVSKEDLLSDPDVEPETCGPDESRVLITQVFPASAPTEGLYKAGSGL